MSGRKDPFGPMPSDLRKEDLLSVDPNRIYHHVPRAAVPAPGSVSNRRFLDRLEDFGWQIDATHGDDTIISHPWGGRMTVRSPHCHKGNSPQIMMEAVEKTAGLTWEHFWTVDIVAYAQEFTTEYADLIDNVLNAERREAERQAEQERKRAETSEAKQLRKEERRRMREEPASARVINLEDGSDVTSELEELATEVSQVSKHRTSVQPRVLALLMETGEPWAVANIAKRLGSTSTATSGACQRLVRDRLAVRVAHGVYQAVRTANDHKVHVSVGTHENPPMATTAPATPEVTTRPIEHLERNDDDQWNETINDVLDLMFPNGFKARHLPLIDRWRQVTVLLLKELEQ